jgi:uncharacterized protein YukE
MTPNWNPNREKVKWDYGAASEAANELRRAASLLRETATRRSAAAEAAKAEWRGRYREEFDRKLSDMLRQAREMADQMERKAREIESASERARAEERRRRDEIERWEREKKEAEREEQDKKEQDKREQDKKKKRG